MLVALHGPVLRAMSQPPYQVTIPEHCLPELHRWRPVVGPVPLFQFHGQRCYCGLRILILHACECGHQHLRQASIESVTIEPEETHDG